MKKRILAVLLALVLALSMLPAAPIVLAANNRPGDADSAFAPVILSEAQRSRRIRSSVPADPDSAYTVRFDLNGYGSDGPAAQTVTAGNPAADPGYSAVIDGMLFDGWYMEPECENRYDFSAPVSADLTLYAAFVRCHTIHFDPNGAPEGGMEDVIVKHGETFVLPECGFLRAGQALNRWTISGRSERYDPGCAVTVYENLTVTANWISAFIYFNSNGGSGEMYTDVCPTDGSYTLPECTYTPPQGKRFLKWSHGFPGDTITVYGTQVVYAIWEDIVCDIVFDANGGTGQMAGAALHSGTDYIFPACEFSPPAGMKFDKWSALDDDGNTSSFYPGQTSYITSNLFVQACWLPQETQTVTVSFSGNGGTGTMPALSVAKGATFTAPPCVFSPPEGKKFRMWSCGGDQFLPPGHSIVVSQDTVFRAIWVTFSYVTVTFDVQGHGTAPDPQIIAYGDTPTPPAAPYENGWKFIGWFRSAGGFLVYDFSSPVLRPVTVYAHWDPVSYQLALSSDANGTAAVSAASAVMDSEITVTATPDPGYVVDRISYTPAGGEAVDITGSYDPAAGTASFTMPPAHVAVAVTFKPIEPTVFPITLETVGSGSAILSKTEAEPWERVTLTAEPQTGSELLRVLLIAADGTERDISERMGFNMPEGPVTVRVEFAVVPHTLRLETSGSGTARLNVESALPGEEILVIVVPDPGWRLKSILVAPLNALPGGGEAIDITNAETFDMLDWDVLVRVEFEEIPIYTVSLSVGAGGTAAVSPERAEAGTEIRVTTTPEPGFRLKSILVTPVNALPEGGEATDITRLGRFLLPESNVRVRVEFEELPPTPVYPVSLEVSAGGAAQVFPELAEAGETVSVSATPERGRRVKSILVRAEDGTMQDVTDTGCFSMPAQAVTVELVFAWINPFKDVKEGKYYYNHVLWAYWHEPRITSGTDKTHFSPGKDCTREQIVTFLYAAEGKPAFTSAESPFMDVTPGKYYFNPVLWAVENGITGGMGNGKFGVGKPCTREQVVTFLWKAAGAPEPSAADCPFTDVKPSKYYYKSVLWAVENGITSGTSATVFGVGKTCTRAQIVTFLYAAYGK